MPGRLFGADFLDRPVTGEKPLDLLTIESTVGRDLSQRIETPDPAPLREVRVKERLGYFILTALLPCEPDEAMGVEGIRRPGDPIERELDPVSLAGFGHLLFNPVQSLRTAEFRLEVRAPIHAALRHRRIQLERAPPHLNPLSSPDLFERLF
jgi:hypothetical protein